MDRLQNQMKYSETLATPLASITRDRLRVWLAASDAVAASGDRRFADDGESLALVRPGQALKHAAVLVLVVNHPGPQMPTIVFTQRTAQLTDHAGQISFPGGRVEPDDVDAAGTAIREAVEETGVDADLIDIVGTLPHYTTGTGYRITPVVAWADQPLLYSPDEREVSEVFEVPAPFLLDPRNHRQETAMYKGRMREYYAIPFGNRYIWGATAGMLITFSRVVAHAEGWDALRPVSVAPDSA